MPKPKKLKYRKPKESILTGEEYKDKEYLRETKTGELVKVTSKYKTLTTPKEVSLKLLSNIQFIYELALARLELKSIGENIRIANNLRMFKLNPTASINKLKQQLAYFVTVDGHYTDYSRIIRFNRTRSVNQYLTHWFYPYKGKFHPQMIRALLNIIGVKAGDTVLDPFIGSGTTGVECQLLGIDCVGVDISPLCVLISKVKAESIDALKEIEKYKEKFLLGVKSSSTVHAQRNIFAKDSIKDIKDEKVKNFFRLAEMIAHSDVARRRRNFEESFNRNMLRMIDSIRDFQEVKKQLGLKLGKVEIKKGDIRNLKALGLQDNNIDGIVTSPPYSIALNYVAQDAHALKALGYNLEEIKDEFIGVRGSGFQKFKLYNQDMFESYREMYRVLKKGRYCVVVIGNVTYQGQEIKTDQMTINQCQKIGFKLEKVIEKIIYGLYNVMQKEYILIFSKPE